MKKSSVFLLLFALLLPLMAEEDTYFGFGFSSGTGTQHRYYDSNNSSEDTAYTLGTLELSTGLVDDSNDRIVASLSFMPVSATSGAFNANSSTYKSSSFFMNIAVNKVWTLGSFELFAPFISVGLGINTNLSIDANETSGDSLEGLSGDFSVGLLMEAMDLEFEFAYKRTYAWWDISGPNISESYERLYFGLNFHN